MSKTLKTADKPNQKITQEELNQFRGTEEYYKHWLNQFAYTDGVQYLAQKAEAYWLIDAIASHQPELLKDPKLKEFQLWKLTVDIDKKTAILTCEKDKDDVILTQNIDYTDFPLPEVKFYLIGEVLMLCGEY